MFHLTISAEDQRRHLHRFWRTASGYWAGPAARAAWGFTALLVIIVLLQLAAQFRINVWNRDFFDALERGERNEIWQQALIFLPLAGANTFFLVALTWGRMAMQREWRGWATSALIKHWAASLHYRQLTLLSGEHRNCEYRIAEDVRVATELPIDFALGLLGSCLGALTFIGVLWSIGGDIVLPLLGHIVVIKGYLVIAVILYSALTTALMVIVGDHLVPMAEEKNQAESELRFAATRLREASETKDFRFATAPEMPAFGASLTRLLAAWRGLCRQLMRTVLVSQGNTLLAPVVGLLLCVPKYLVNAMTLGEVIQAAAAFVIVQGACNWLVDNYPRVADWLSSVNRVAQLLDWLDGTAAAGGPMADRDSPSSSMLALCVAGPDDTAPLSSGAVSAGGQGEDEHGYHDQGPSLRL